MRSEAYVVYSYTRGADGSLGLVERKMFTSAEESKAYFFKKKAEMLTQEYPVATCLELNREICYENELFMCESQNMEAFSRLSDFAVG